MAKHSRRPRRLFDLELRRREQIGVEVDQEIAFHLQERVDALMARGLSEAQAIAEANRMFGNTGSERDALVSTATLRDRRLDWSDRLDTIVDDLRLATRQLRRAPMFAFGVVVAIALGIGANATMFSVIDRLMLRPPAQVASPDNVYTLVRPGRERLSSAMSYVTATALRDGLASVATLTTESFFALNVGVAERTRSENAIFVDRNYFDVLGTRSTLGRTFNDDDFSPSTSTLPVVISYGSWQRDFGGELNAIGKELVVDERRLRIVGVAPMSFNGVGLDPVDLWLPNSVMPMLTFAPANWQTSAVRSTFPIIRLKGGVGSTAISQRATTIQRAVERSQPRGDTTIAIELRSILPSRAPALSPEAKIATMLGAVSLFVLVIACFNAGNLMLARALGRQREVAIRVALGVSRARLLQQLAADSLILSMLGAVAAIAVAACGSLIMRQVLLRGIVWGGRLIDGRTLAFISVSTVVTTCLTCSFPALLLGRRFDLRRSLSNASARQAGRSPRSKLTSFLVVTQGTLSALLLIGALLFVHSLREVQSVPVGLDLERTTIAMLNPTVIRSPSANVDGLFTDLAERASRIAGVSSVSIAEGAPFTVLQVRQIAVPTLSPTLDAIRNGTVLRAVDAKYFETIGTPIVRGHPFDISDDRIDAEPVAIINASMAAMLWPNADAIGKCIQVAPAEPEKATCRRIVGIASDVRTDMTSTDRNDAAAVYVPLTQGGQIARSRAVIVRGTNNPLVAEQIRLAATKDGYRIPVGAVFSVRSKLAPQLRPWELGATMFGVFGALAFVLAALGMYAMLAYNVAQRRQEMGVRIAIGARAIDIVSLIGKQGAVLALISVLVALASAVWLAPVVQPLLFQTSARSPSIYSFVAVTMIVVAIGASLIPAWRGARVDPLTAIRQE